MYDNILGGQPDPYLGGQRDRALLGRAAGPLPANHRRAAAELDRPPPVDRRLGSGGQGVVYLTERRGTDSFTLPVALKVFSPERYEDERSYDEAMARMAAVASRVALIQQDNLLDVHNWVDRSRIRMMEMEWVDGYDLAPVADPQDARAAGEPGKPEAFQYINQVIVTDGAMQPRLKPGIAIAIVRDCLAALAALHREGIVHGDLKPSNIMLKRTGNAKIIDIGSAFDLESARRGGPARRPTPPRRCSKARPARRGATWPAWATC